MTDCYGKNKTMQLLGHQHSFVPFWGDETVKKSMDEIAEARPFSFTLDAASDIFMLGYIQGKRSEHARRKKHYNSTIRASFK